MSAHGLLAHLYVQARQIQAEINNERDPRVMECLLRSRMIMESTSTLAHLHAQQAEQIEAMTALLRRVEVEVVRLKRPLWARLLGALWDRLK